MRMGMAWRSPRTRGDGPSELYGWLRRGLRSPRTRGDGPMLGKAYSYFATFSPTHGDGPALNGAETPVLMFSPGLIQSIKSGSVLAGASPSPAAS